MLAWTQWKYPLTVTLLFLLVYGLFGILNPTPSVDLPDDIRLLVNDRHRLKLPDISFTDARVAVDDNVAVVAAPELWYPADRKSEGNENQKSDSESLESSEIHTKFTSPAPRKDSRNIDENADESQEVGSRTFPKWLHDREIVGNERFVNRFQNGIQKPEDFYERNKDIALKITNKYPTTTVRIQAADGRDQNRLQSNKSHKLSTSSLLSLTTRPLLLVTEKNRKFQIHTDIQKTTKSQKTNMIKRTPSVGRSDSFSETGNKTDSTVTSLQSRGSQDVSKRRKSRRPKSHVGLQRNAKVNGTTLADLKSAAHPPLIVNATGAFLDRVVAYNAAIAAVSTEILKRRGYGPWRDVASTEDLIVIWGNTDDFLERVSDHARVKTVLMPWIEDSPGSEWSSLSDRSNVLVKKYFAWSATFPLCAWIQTPGFTKAHWDAVYDRDCNEEMDRAVRPQSLEFMYFRAKPININHYWPNYGTSYPAYFYTRPPPYVFYIHLLQDAVINTVGDIISGNLKLVPYTCSHDNLATVPAEYPERPVYRELFVMTQFWGTSFFHKMVEVMPRVAPYIDFLRANPGVQIHAPEDRSQVSEMLGMLGIDPVRVVTGVTRAKLVYLPQGTPCGFPEARSIQLLSKLLRDHVRASGRAPRDRLIYVRRSGLRRFSVESPIEFVLRDIAERHRLNYTVFSDHPTPPLSTASQLFNAAVAVVGPHGAGLSNVIFSEPGTALIEGVCNEPHVNMCYEMTAHMLGLRYHAIPSRGGCERVVDIAASDVETAVEKYVDMVLADMR